MCKLSQMPKIWIGVDSCRAAETLPRFLEMISISMASSLRSILMGILKRSRSRVTNFRALGPFKMAIMEIYFYQCLRA